MPHDFSEHSIAFQTPWIAIYEKGAWYALASPTGRHGGGALILDSQKNVLLVEIYRYPIDRTVLEIPRGASDPKKDEDSLATAVREAQEELGADLSQARLIDLGIVHPDDGILAYENRLCAALLPEPFAAYQVDAREVLGYRIIAFSDLKKMIHDGEINDAHTIVSVFRLDEILRKEDTAFCEPSHPKADVPTFFP